ncbi:hypothetical protein N1851_013576 [Merluccius polli]|uniref:Uncharacterized protein n=1 Tax=Merluccius polli TaxID=89951 RepID=A0AA47P572_MERPO|nr:hypothetical protein N1851_013576 [Merluccius polli]
MTILQQNSSYIPYYVLGSRSLAKSDDDDDGDDDDDEGDEGCEPQLILGGREEEEEEVFRFTSPPHSARRGQGGGDQGPLQTERGPTLLIETRRRNGPQPEDDFVGSESDEDSFPRPTAEFGSKVEKDQLCYSLHHQTAAAPSTRSAAPPTPDPAQTRNHKPRPDSDGTDQTRHTDPAIGYPPVSSSSPSSSPSSSSSLSAGVSDERTVRAPTHCLSPGGGRQGCGGNHRDGGNHRHGSKQGHGGNRGHCGNQGHGGNQGQLWPVGGGLAPEQQRSPASLCRSSLREVLPGELVRHKVEDKSQEPTGSASSGVRPAGSALRGRGEYEEEEEEEEEEDDDDEQEQRMLASLRRGSEEEEEEPGARGLSASQIHRCAVSISISSDDTSFSACPPPAVRTHHPHPPTHTHTHTSSFSTCPPYPAVCRPPIVPTITPTFAHLILPL